MMADTQSSEFIALAQTSINSLNSVINKIPNTANAVKTEVDKCTKSLLSIVKTQSELITKLKANSISDSNDSIINGRFNNNKKLFIGGLENQF